MGMTYVLVEEPATGQPGRDRSGAPAPPLDFSHAIRRGEDWSLVFRVQTRAEGEAILYNLRHPVYA